MRTLALALACTLATAAHAADKARRMTAEAVKLKGLTLTKTLDADLDGDGTKELIGVCTGPKGVQLVLIGEEPAGAVVSFMAPPALGKEMSKAEVKSLAPPKGSQQVILEIYDDTPDEKVKRVRVYGADGSGKDVKLKEIFTSKVERTKAVDDRPEWETDKTIVSYGDPRAGWYFEDMQDDGISEVVVRRNTGAQIIHVKKDGGDDVKLLTGVRERVWQWDQERGRYSEGPEQLNDFLPAYAITGVEASGAWVEPKVLKELKAQALSDALSNTAAKEANAPKGKKAAKEDEGNEPSIDLQPFITPGADGNLATAWIENDAKGDGKGEWLEVTLDEAEDIHMVRLVLGCVNTKSEFSSHNVPESFTITMDNGAAHEVSRKNPGKFENVLAFTDNLVKMADRPWAKTTLVFFDGKTEAKKVRITLDKAIKQGKGNQTCISEVSVH